MSLRRFLLLSVAVFCLAGCTSIDYMGKYYPATTNVDLFFSKDDVKRPYEVMGQAIETADDFVSEQKMHDALKEKGRAVGADAIVVESFKRIEVGETTNTDQVGTAEVRQHHHHHKRTTVNSYSHSTANTTYKTERQIKALFLKYKEK